MALGPGKRGHFSGVDAGTRLEQRAFVKCLSLVGVLVLGAGLAACSAPVSHGDHAAGEAEVAEVGQPVSCGPGLARYPVKGPHNGGYDANALSYTCPPHPGGSPDNSDFIGGSHYGNDIFGAKGTPIVAPASGVIVKAGWDTTGGNRVTVQDGCGWHYYHAHLDSIAVSVGQSVNAGDLIGTLGNSGSAQGTSPHLHFSIYPEAYDAGIDPFPHLEAVDGTSCPPQCTAHCEGSKIVGSDCGVGDCGIYGANCVDDAKGVRCASVFCPALGQKKVCIDDAHIGDCNDGAIGVGDCSAYGAGCVDDAKGARCVVVFCLDQPATPHDVCLPNGQLGHCNEVGGLTAEDCPPTEPCVATSSGSSCGKAAAEAPGDGPSAGGASGSGGADDGWAGSADSLDPTAGGSAVESGGTEPVQGGCSCSTPARSEQGRPLPLALALGSIIAAGIRRSRRREPRSPLVRRRRAE